MINRAAAIIYTRMKHIGFPQGLMIQPEDFTTEEAASAMGYIHDAMRNDIELRARHLLSSVVIADDRHVVLGAVGFLRDIVAGAWDTRDAGDREIHGFVGYAWKRADFSADAGFPTREGLLDLLSKWLKPHWEEPDYAKWAHFPHMSAYDEEAKRAVAMRAADAGNEKIAPPSAGKTEWIFAPGTEGDAVAWALEQIKAGRNITLCTNLFAYSEMERNNRFQYAVSMEASAPEKRAEAKPRTAAAERRPQASRQGTGLGLDQLRQPEAAGERREAPPADKTRPASPTSHRPGRNPALAAGIAGAVLLAADIALRAAGVFADRPEGAGSGKAWLFWLLAVAAAALLGFAAFTRVRAKGRGTGMNPAVMPLPARRAANGDPPKDPPRRAEARPETGAGEGKGGKEETEDIYRW